MSILADLEGKMQLSCIGAFALLSLALLSPWASRRAWGVFLLLALALGWYGGLLTPVALSLSLGWVGLWCVYAPQKRGAFRALLFALLVLLSFGFTWHLFPGFHSYTLTSKFSLGFGTPLLGLLPLALCIPLARSCAEWGPVVTGLALGCVGIALLAFLALATGSVHWHYKLPDHALLRYFNNFALVAIPQEAFYRGCVQRELSNYFKKEWPAIVLTSVIFTLAHLYWSPSLPFLALVFIASMLYGWVYARSGKIESAILCHFLLNFLHMTFFSYHAL